eukprot:g1767.t1
MLDDPTKPSYRYSLLVCNCFLTFGSYFCFDMPTVLETDIQNQVVAGFTQDVDTYYTLFYTIYAWCNMCMSLFAGWLVDRIGMRKTATLFLTLCMVGSSLFALGASLKSAKPLTRYIIMFIGRFIFGLGGGSITIAQNAITAKWFKGRELAFAFGCTLTLSRVGSIVNYDATSVIYNNSEAAYPGLGLGITLWVGAILVAISYLFLWGFIVLDSRADHKQQDIDGPATSATPFLADDASKQGGASGGAAGLAHAETKSSFVSDMCALPVTFWLVCLIITFFYNLVFPFMAVAVDFLRTNYGDHTNEWASTRASTVYMVSMVVSPFLGAAVDYFGRRDNLAVAGTGLSIPVFIMLGHSSIEPIVPLLILGCCYSVCAAALWPTVQLLVDKKVVGRANGIATSMQMLGIGVCNIITGVLKDSNMRHSPTAAPCCTQPNSTVTGESNVCYHKDGSALGVCEAKHPGRGCEGLNDKDMKFQGCYGVDYSPMLQFFVAMATIAFVCAWVLKWLDRRERALYIGIRDKNRIFEEKVGRPPEAESTSDMAEATRMARQVLGSGRSCTADV